MNKINTLKQLIERGNNFLNKGYTSDEPAFQAWNNKLIRFLEKEYGKDSTTTNTFMKRYYTLTIWGDETPKSAFIKAFEQDLRVTLADLESLLEEAKEQDLSESSREINDITTSKNKNAKEYSPTFNVNINNSNSNTNTINIDFTIEEIRKKVEDNTFIGDEDKNILLEKLNQIEELQKSNKSKNEKWKIAKEILKFVIDKGADIAIMFLPQIIKALN